MVADGAVPDEDAPPLPESVHKLILEVFDDHVVVTEVFYGGKRVTGTGGNVHAAFNAWWDASERERSGHVEG